jgi:hypothetical protein
MKHFRPTKPTHCLAGLLFGLLCATIVLPPGVDAASASRTGRGFGPVYDAAHETTFEGTIQEIVTSRTSGVPVGLHLMVAGPNGLVDTHVGPFLSQETKAVLQPGVPVRIVGASTTLHGKTYFLARLLTIDGNTITVRSSRGALAYEPSNGEHVSRSRASLREPNGVAQ